MKQPDNKFKHSNMTGQRNVKGKSKYIPGMPKAKAYQHPIDESSPPIKVPKNAKYKSSK